MYNISSSSEFIYLENVNYSGIRLYLCIYIIHVTDMKLKMKLGHIDITIVIILLIMK